MRVLLPLEKLKQALEVVLGVELDLDAALFLAGADADLRAEVLIETAHSILIKGILLGFLIFDEAVTPRQIVGALANEGGLGREDFGRIDIRADHSLVDLPAHLSDEVQRKLARTRISGQLIELRPDRGGPRHDKGGKGKGRGDWSDRGGRERREKRY